MEIIIHTSGRIILLAAIIFTLVIPAHQAQALFGDFTIGDEIELGKEFDDKVRSTMPMIEDPQITGYVKDLVDRIVEKMPHLPYPVRTAVINHPSINAFAVPGGYVYVFTGMITSMETEDQLAAVICHELAHVSQRHVAKRMEEMEIFSLGSILGTLGGFLLGALGGNVDSAKIGQAIMTVSGATAAAAYLIYTQDNEREADHIGMNYLIAAGFNPKGMPETFKIMLDQRWTAPNSKIPSYLATHPSLEARITYLNSRINGMPPQLLQRKTDNSEFIKVQTVLKGKVTDPVVTLAQYENAHDGNYTCMDYLGMGLSSNRLKKIAKARKYFQSALECGSNEPVILREAGIFHFQMGEYDQATALLQKASIMDPKDALALFYYARLMAEKGEFQYAVNTMQKVIKIVPEDPEVRFHYGRLLGESGDNFGGHLQLGYYALYSRDEDKTLFHLEKAQGFAKTEAQHEQLAELNKKAVDRFELD